MVGGAGREGSYRRRGEMRLWDNEALMGWHRPTDVDDQACVSAS